MRWEERDGCPLEDQITELIVGMAVAGEHLHRQWVEQQPAWRKKSNKRRRRGGPSVATRSHNSDPKVSCKQDIHSYFTLEIFLGRNIAPLEALAPTRDDVAKQCPLDVVDVR
jgi:hypothetical protein